MHPVFKDSSVFSPVSPQAATIAHLFVGVLCFISVILLIVVGYVTFICIRYRAKPGDESEGPQHFSRTSDLEGEPPQRFGSPWLELIWTSLPLIGVMVIFAFTIIVMGQIDPGAPYKKPDVVIIGHQYWWEFRYPKTGVVTANEMHMPVGRPVWIQLMSGDVIHDFWVAQIGRKMDAIPGHPNYYWLECDQPGIYLGACAEFCGAEHAWMRIRVIAESEKDFNAWQVSQLQQIKNFTGDAAAGRKLFGQLTCMNCHVAEGSSDKQMAGPNLAHLGSRQTLAAGRLDNTLPNLERWLINPQDVKPGVNMPDLRLKPDEAHELAAYLESLK